MFLCGQVCLPVSPSLFLSLSLASLFRLTLLPSTPTRQCCSVLPLSSRLLSPLPFPPSSSFSPHRTERHNAREEVRKDTKQLRFPIQCRSTTYLLALALHHTPVVSWHDAELRRYVLGYLAPWKLSQRSLHEALPSNPTAAP